MVYTPHYQLPQYEDNDTTSYLTTYNNTMTLLDNAIYANQQTIDKHTTDLSGVEQQLTTLNDEVNGNTGDISALQTLTSGQGATINSLNQQVSEQNNTIAGLGTKVDTLQEGVGTVYRGVLTANETTLAIPIGEFNDDTLVDVYTSQFGLTPLTVELREAETGQPNICVTTWDAQASDVNVAVLIR